MKRIIAIFISLCIMTSISIIATADEVLQGTAYVTADQLNIREQPQGAILGQVPYGTEVDILSPAANGYYYVYIPGFGNAYLYGQYLVGQYIKVPSAKPVPRTVYEYVYVDDGGAHPLVFVNRSTELGPLAMRREPTKASAVVDWLCNGEPLLMISDTVEDGNGYCRVHTLNGEVGYVHSGSLRVYPPDGVRYRSSSPDVKPDLEQMGFRFKVNLPVFLDSIEMIED